MIILILIIAFGILFYIGFQFYQFDNSPFAKETGYNFIQMMTNGKVRALKGLYDQSVQSKAKVIANVRIDEAAHTNFADAIVIHSSGIHIITLNEKSGWISGTDKSYEWVEQLHGGKKNMFPNPVHENLRMAYAISDLVPEIEKEQIESIIGFSNGCSFQHIEIQSNLIEVLKYSELPKWMRSLAGNGLAQEEMERIFTLLKKYSTK